MPKKHFICTHTFVSEDAKKKHFASCKNLSSKEFLAYSRNDSAKLVQHWLGSSDFFFCHWVADDEDAILELLASDGSDKLFNTMCSEMHYFISEDDGVDEVYSYHMYED